MRLRQLMRESFAMLPKIIRHPVYRNLLRVSYDLPPNFSVKIAETRDEIEQAFTLVHDAYVETGLMVANARGLRLGFYHSLPTTTTVIAKEGDVVLGTFSIVGNSPAGLPMDDDFATSRLKTSGARIGEISALAIRKNWRAQQGAILFPMLKFLGHYCTRYLAIEILQIATSPRRRDFYEALLNFKRLDEHIIDDPYVNGAKMCALYLDLRQTFADYQRIYRGAPRHRSLYYYFFEWQSKKLIFPQRTLPVAYDPKMRPEYLKHFFANSGELCAKKKSLLRHIYRHPAYADFVASLQSDFAYSYEQRDFRHPMDSKAVLSDPFQGSKPVQEAHVWDVTSGGIKIRCAAPLILQRDYTLTVDLDSTMTVGLRVKPVWQNPPFCGLKIETAPLAWLNFIERLQHYLRSA